MAEKPKHNEQIESNQDALLEAGLELNAPPEVPGFSEVIDDLKAISKVRARLKIKSDTLRREQQEALSGAMTILDEIDTMPAGDLKETAFADFKAAYWELILTPKEIALFRDQVDDHLDQHAAPEVPYEDFLKENKLPSPESLITDLKSIMVDPNTRGQEMNENGYRVMLNKTQEKFVLEIRASKDHPGEVPSPNWSIYRTAISKALGELNVQSEMKILSDTDAQKKRGITQFTILAENYADFVPPNPGAVSAETVEPASIDDVDGDGISDGIDGDNSGETDLGFNMMQNLEPEVDGEGTVLASPLFNKTGIYDPEDIVAKVKEIMGDPKQNSFELGQNGYSFMVAKTKEGIQINFGTTEELEGEVIPEWRQFLKETTAAFKAAGLGELEIKEAPTGLLNANELSEILISSETEGFVAPEQEAATEADDILNEDGMLELEDGTVVLPNAATRTDGSLPPGERTKQLYKDLSTAIRDGDIGEIFSKGMELLVSLFGAGKEWGFGTSWDDVVDGLSFADGLDDGAPSNIAELYELQAGKLTKLKYKSFDAITTNISSPGDRVAAAALLGVVKNVDVDKPSENHCSGWVDTIAKKAGLGTRYNLEKCAMVNPKYSKDRGSKKETQYRGWRKGAKTEKTHISQIGGLKPGDMVIEYNGNRFTGFHDEIVVDVKGGKMLVASQNKTKGSSGSRSLQWKTINNDRIATVVRPGWTGGSTSRSSGPAVS